MYEGSDGGKGGVGRGGEEVSSLFLLFGAFRYTHVHLPSDLPLFCAWEIHEFIPQWYNKASVHHPLLWGTTKAECLCAYFQAITPGCTCVTIVLSRKPYWFNNSFLLLQEHSGRVFRLQFDDFQIVSSSHDDSILIWDFLDPVPPGPMETDQSNEKKALT